MDNIILLAIFFLTPLFYYRVIKEFSWKSIKTELLPRKKSLKTEAIGSIKLFFLLLIGFILINIVLTIIEQLLGFGLIDMENVDNFVVTNFYANAIIFCIIITITIFAEEFFFRAFLMKKTGIFFSTIVFTFFHLGYESITQTIGVFFLGLVLAYWFKKNNSIIQNYFGHLIYNSLAILLYLI